MDSRGITKTDRWSLRPGLASLVIVAAITLVSQLPGTLSFILIPVSFLGYAIGAVIVSGVAAFLLIKKQPRRASSIFLIFGLPVLLWWPLVWVANVAHLGLTVGLGIGQFGVVEESKDKHFKAYDWSVGLAGGPSTILIHDSTGRIAEPLAKQVNFSEAGETIEETCAGKVSHLVGHYYICVL